MNVTGARVDDDFRDLGLDALADAALDRARALGASHADLRVERIRHRHLSLRDAERAGGGESVESGLAVRVVVDGAWGFAASTGLTAADAARTAAQAVHVAQVCRPLTSERVDLADEPTHTGEWVSAYAVDPFAVPDVEQSELFADWSRDLLRRGLDHVDASFTAVKEQKFYADLAGTRTVQQRVRVQPALTGVVVSADAVETMRTVAPPVGRGWEYLTGTAEQGAWDWAGELAELPELAAEKLKAPSVDAGRYDLVIHPSNLWLTIHESIGHATELDRALGYEAAYAGTSFATPDQLGSLRYGAAGMHVTGDRTVPHGLATIGWDDEGVATTQWDIIADGILTGYQLDRRIAHLTGAPRSNGCAFADSYTHVPIQRMANVSLQSAPDGPSTDEIIAGVERGIYIVGDKSWSIDMQRYNFQFTGQRFYRIESGQLVGMVKDVAYQATTTDFWGSMAAVGGPSTWVLGGAFNCGKGQPGQVAAVSHGCPTALFTDVRVLNTVQEGQS
ncbi:MAG: TldD/PmbA family protein [Angustibacter sp.]